MPLDIGYELVNGQIVLKKLQKESSIANPANQISITGTVLDENGVGLPGVNVALKGTTIGTITSGDGKYNLSIPNDNAQGTLTFSFIGYATQEVPLNGQTIINISLVVDTQSLTEVVVVGYGEQKKADVTGATATITSKDFNTGVMNNPLQAVQGKVAGLVISTSNSDPTNNRPTIRLRGISSLNADAEPLIVIDGVLGASLNAVAPEDIEKYDVLKDASATAIYGSRGANGVIIITTKRGRAGKASVDYNTYVGFSHAYKLPNVMTPDDYFNKYNELNPTKPSTSTARTDWFKAITRTAVSMNHNIGVSGGSENFTYRGSVSYLQQPGIALNSEQDRTNARINLTQKGINNRLEVQLNLSANVYKKQFSDYGAFQNAATYSPLQPIYNTDGTFNAPNIAFHNLSPYAQIVKPTANGNQKQLLGNIKLYFEIVKNLKVGINYSYSSNTNNYGYFRPKSYNDVNGQVNKTVSYGQKKRRRRT